MTGPVRMSLSRKLVAIVIAVVSLGCFGGGAAFLVYWQRSSQAGELRKLSVMAEIARGEVLPALEFRDAEAARGSLSKFSIDPQILRAAVFLEDGTLFAAHPAASAPALAESGPADGGWRLSLPLLLEGRRVGTLMVESDLHLLREQFRRNLVILAVLLVAVAALMALIASRLITRLMRPLQGLAQTVQVVGEKQDYSQRVPEGGDDEVAFLVAGFNRMLARIEERDHELQLARDTLERRVLERTEELKSKEEQLLHAQKLEAVGRLAGGIAHDFNNLLTAINGFSELGLIQVGADDPVRSSLQEIRKAGERATSLTKQLLAYSRRQVLQPRVIGLKDVLNDMSGMIRRLIGESISFSLSLPEEEIRIRADLGQVQQVIMNLVINARDAIVGTGSLGVELALERLEPEWSSTREPTKPGHYAVVRVRDSGSGMDAETLSHLFEPFYTTKEQGKGTGLGLSMVYGIVQQSGGAIQVRSVPSAGTVMAVAFPRVDDAAATTHAVPLADLSPSGTETILLAEDEESVRKYAMNVLGSKGYRVIEAADGEAAFELLKTYPGKVDLLLSDVVMPKMSGRELAERAVLVRNDLRVLLMSGFTDDEAVHKAVRSRQYLFLPKPYTPQALLERVRQAIDRKGEHSGLRRIS